MTTAKSISFLEFFQKQFGFHYWRETTYYKEDECINDRQIEKDINLAIGWYKDKYNIDVTDEDKKEAYEYIKQLTDGAVEFTSNED